MSSEVVIVENLRAAQLNFPCPDEDVCLNPGSNNVPIEVVRRHVDSPGIALWVKAGWIKAITVGAPRKEGLPPPSPENFVKMGAQLAIMTVKDEIDLDRLDAWKTIESRATVIAAIDSRIAMLSAAPPPPVPEV